MLIAAAGNCWCSEILFSGVHAGISARRQPRGGGVRNGDDYRGFKREA